MWIGTRDFNLRFDVVTLFPAMVATLGAYGVLGRAVNRGIVAIHEWNPRDFCVDRHHTVDDRAYGGGPGMVMKVAPLLATISAVRQQVGPQAKLVYLSPQGGVLHQGVFRSWAHSCQNLILLCGRYEGIDERLYHYIDEEWSLGDYVLSGGELAAMVVMEGVARLLPGVLGHEESAQQDSFHNGMLDCPHYTRPERFMEMTVPEVLLNGNHAAISQWRHRQALGRTWLKRPDLLSRLVLTQEQQQWLQDFIDEYSSSKGKHED